MTDFEHAVDICKRRELLWSFGGPMHSDLSEDTKNALNGRFIDEAIEALLKLDEPTRYRAIEIAAEQVALIELELFRMTD